MFHTQQMIDNFASTRHEPPVIPGKSSLSINLQKPSHPSIPRQFLQANINGTQSLKQHQTSSRSPYPSTFTVQSNHSNSYTNNIEFPINTSQQTKRTTGTPVYPTSRGYMHFERPANV
jgi:hypothetical protein